MKNQHLNHQQEAETWFQGLQDSIIAGLASLEAEYGDGTATFRREKWRRQDKNHPNDPASDGGGGTMAKMYGELFEKAGVNFSSVHGHFSDKFRGEIPGTNENPYFHATGVSLVIHPKSPFVPIIHMNTRMISTQKQWFGGGIDLTPALPNPQETAQFHQGLRTCCDAFNPRYYRDFKEHCDRYFFLPHRDEPRGVGGIFYDNLDSGDWGEDFAFTRAVGEEFLKLYEPLVRANAERSWNENEAAALWQKRSRYVEFNLLFDRGTRFGIMTGGNPEAILVSLPPRTGW